MRPALYPAEWSRGSSPAGAIQSPSAHCLPWSTGLGEIRMSTTCAPGRIRTCAAGLQPVPTPSPVGPTWAGR